MISISEILVAIFATPFFVYVFWSVISAHIKFHRKQRGRK